MSRDFGHVGLAKWVKGWLLMVAAFLPPFGPGLAGERGRELLWFCRAELGCSLGERSIKIQYHRKFLRLLFSINYFIKFFPNMRIFVRL